MNIAFCTLSFASSTTPEINVDYLNELTGPKVTWETATESDPDIVYINGAYYKYTYHKPDDYTETNTGIDINDDVDNISSVVFKDIAGSDWRGGFYSYSREMGDIKADFVNNSSEGGGGAVYLTGNYYSYDPTAGNITGTFIGNHIDGGMGGGAVAFDHVSGSSITGNFINNYAQSTNSSASGGAIYIYGNVRKNITGNFIGNHVQAAKHADGGAIYNGFSYSGVYLTLINSSFYNNYAQTESTDKSYAQGGAIIFIEV